MHKFIDITENIYISRMPIFHISKYLGLAPFQIKEYGNNYRVTLSIPVVIVSYIFGVILGMYNFISQLLQHVASIYIILL